MGYISFSVKWTIEKVSRFTASQQGLGYSVCLGNRWPVSVGYFFQSIGGFWASSVNKLQTSQRNQFLSVHFGVLFVGTTSKRKEWLGLSVFQLR